MLTGAADERELTATLAAILTALRAPLRVLGRELEPSFTGGISFFPERGSDADTLLEAARRAMMTAEREM